MCCSHGADAGGGAEPGHQLPSLRDPLLLQPRTQGTADGVHTVLSRL